MTASVFISWLLYCWTEGWGYIWGKCGILWTDARQKALEKMYYGDPNGKSDYKMGALYGARWIGHYVADCANLLRWAAKKSGDDKVHSGSNLIWQCDLKVKGALKDGQRTDGQPLKPGSFVFTGDSYDKHGHVGCYIGNGDVIEDAETKTGVVKSKITDSKWKWWGERNGMEFDVKEGEYILPAEDVAKPGENTPNQPNDPVDDEKTPADVMPTIRKGDKGNAVRMMQQALLALGYDLPRYGADGDFGAETEKAVKEFQKDKGLSQDGVVGRKTWAALEQAMEAPEEPKTYTVTISGLTGEQADELIKKYGGEKKED